MFSVFNIKKKPDKQTLPLTRENEDLEVDDPSPINNKIKINNSIIFNPSILKLLHFC
jgi:hypothetical protein